MPSIYTFAYAHVKTGVRNVTTKLRYKQRKTEVLLGAEGQGVL